MSTRAFLLFVLIHVAVGFDDYYWRTYDPSSSQIPVDAVDAGQSQSQGNLYIGQTSIWADWGIQSTTIVPGAEVWAPSGGAKRAVNFVQILCSQIPPKRFIWLPATSNTLHLVGLNVHIVRGGQHENHATYIGRVKHQGNVVIGKVYTHDINNSEMEFVFNNRDYRVKTYEVLAIQQ